VLISTYGTLTGKKSEEGDEKKVISVVEPPTEKRLPPPVTERAVEPAVANVVEQAKEIVPAVAAQVIENEALPVAVSNTPSISDSTAGDLASIIVESSSIVEDTTTATKPPPVDQVEIPKEPLTVDQIIYSLPPSTRETLVSHLSSLESQQSELLAKILTQHNVLFEEFILDISMHHADDIKVRNLYLISLGS
jgi:hypothetical protein